MHCCDILRVEVAKILDTISATRSETNGEANPLVITNPITQHAEAYLQALAEDLAISDTRYEQAFSSYKSFGDWLHRSESTLRKFRPQVYVQGSFRLGTVIRPLSEEEDYDVDCVCELKLLDTDQISQKALKEFVGVEVRSYHRARSMIKPVRERRRCWVLDYADDAQFHMDVIPCVPDAERQRQLLASLGRSLTWAETAVAITDRERWNYEIIDANWCRSNPKAYAEWFRQRMGLEFERRRKILADSIRAKVEDIPDYRVRTPLQAAIMILKRHRDLRFGGDPDNRPISIIITTLAAHAYSGEEAIGAALLAILSRMDQFIEVEDGRYVVRNPTDPMENFADKWAEYPERAKGFFDWLDQARRDFASVISLNDGNTISETVASFMGRPLAERTLRRASSGGRLLRAASVAAPAGLSFPDAPRVPTAPQGFA